MIEKRKKITHSKASKTSREKESLAYASYAIQFICGVCLEMQMKNKVVVFSCNLIPKLNNTL